MAQNNQIQLLPRTTKQTRIGLKTTETKKDYLFVIGIIILSSVLAVGVFFSYLKANLEQEIVNIDSELQSLEQKRDKKFEKEILVVKKQLGLIFNLIENHNYWSEAFVILENLLQDQVQLEAIDLGGESSGEINIVGSAANLSTIARQMASFLTDDFIQDVALNETKIENNGTVKFGMSLTINPTKLLKNKIEKAKKDGK